MDGPGVERWRGIANGSGAGAGIARIRDREGMRSKRLRSVGDMLIEEEEGEGEPSLSAFQDRIGIGRMDLRAVLSVGGIKGKDESKGGVP